MPISATRYDSSIDHTRNSGEPKNKVNLLVNGEDVDIGRSGSKFGVIVMRILAQPILFAVVLASSTGAFAQDARSTDVQDETGQEEAAEGEVGGSEIVVTATRRAERLQDVPLSITAVTSDDLARLNATQFRDYANTIPALTISSNGGAGQTQLTIRGVTSGFDVASTVGIYVDDVPYGGSTVFTGNNGLTLDSGLFDLDRIEVLRGPQGTLYGASSMGGLLKYVTRLPDLNDFAGAAQGGISFTRDGGTNYEVAAGVNLPVVRDRLAVRASGFYTRDGGFIDNVTLNEDHVGRAAIYGGRLDVLFQPTEDLSIRVTGFAQDTHRNGTAQADYTLAGRPVDGDREQRRLLREPFDQKFRLVSGTINYDLGPAELTSITSYQKNDVSYRLDGSPLYVPLFSSLGLPIASTAIGAGVSTDKFTQEVRLASSSTTTIEWIVGGFYTNEDSVTPSFLLPYNADGSPFPLDLGTARISSTYKEIAGFGNVTVHLSDRFDVTGGLRYAHNRQTYAQAATGLLLSPVPTQKSAEGVLTYLANAKYRFSEHATAYARFATGYRPGGPNVVTLDPVTGAPLGPRTFESDSLNSYEIGFKGETADRTFGIDTAAYHLDWKDMLVSGVRNGLLSFINAQGAKIDGAELTLTARPSRTVTFTGAFAYQDARLTAATPDLGGRKGERLPNVPRFTAAVNADYRSPGLGVAPTFGATLRFVSDRKAGFDANPNLPQFDLGDYVTMDLRAGATFGPVTAQVFVRNLFDNRGAYSAYTALSSFGGPARVAVLQPRTIGLSAMTRF